MNIRFRMSWTYMMPCHVVMIHRILVVGSIRTATEVTNNLRIETGGKLPCAMVSGVACAASLMEYIRYTFLPNSLLS